MQLNQKKRPDAASRFETSLSGTLMSHQFGWSEKCSRVSYSGLSGPFLCHMSPDDGLNVGTFSKINGRGLEGKLPFCTQNNQVIEGLTGCMCLCTFTPKPDSPYEAQETSQRKAKPQLWKCKHFRILLYTL